MGLSGSTSWQMDGPWDAHILLCIKTNSPLVLKMNPRLGSLFIVNCWISLKLKLNGVQCTKSTSYELIQFCAASVLHSCMKLPTCSDRIHYIMIKSFLSSIFMVKQKGWVTGLENVNRSWYTHIGVTRRVVSDSFILKRPNCSIQVGTSNNRKLKEALVLYEPSHSFSFRAWEMIKGPLDFQD